MYNYNPLLVDFRIGEQIAKRLNEVGISQRELADLTGITEVAMSRYIRGERIPNGTIVANITHGRGRRPDRNDLPSARTCGQLHHPADIHARDRQSERSGQQTARCGEDFVIFRTPSSQKSRGGFRASLSPALKNFLHYPYNPLDIIRIML